jgi:hypothetical protein
MTMTKQTYAERTKGLMQPGCGLKTTEWLLKGYEFSRQHGAYLVQQDIDFLDRMIASMKAEITRMKAERIANGPAIHMPIGGHA